MNYIEGIAEMIREEAGEERFEGDALLYHAYALLALTTGEETTLEDVHHAWSVWQMQSAPDHSSLVPFKELEERIQEYDRPYAEAIQAAARRLLPFPGAPRYYDRKWGELS